MTIRFKCAGQTSSIFVTESTTHIAGYNPLDEWPGGSAGFATYSSIELRYSTVADPSPGGAPTGIMVRAKVHGASQNGWEFIIDQNAVHPPTVGVVGTVVTITGDGGVTTLADVLAALLAETDVTDVWDVITLPLYEPTDVLQAEGTDGEGPVTVETINGYDYDDSAVVGAMYAKADGHPLPFDGEILYLGIPGYDQIPGSFRVLWNVEHLDQIGDIELYIPAATGRDPANKVYEVESLPDGILWEGPLTAVSVLNLTFDSDIANIVPSGGSDHTLKNAMVVALRGEGAGQSAIINTYDASTYTAVLQSTGSVGFDTTTYVAIIPASYSDVFFWRNSAVAALVGSSRLDVSVGAYQSGLVPLQPTTAGRTLDVTAGGTAGIDWANVEAPTTTVNLSGTTVKDATDVNTDTDALLARLTATRAGYLDKLNISGNVASSSEVTAIQNNTRVVIVVPEVIERPDSGTVTYRVELFLYDEIGNMEAPDSAPTVDLVNQSGTSRTSRLDSTTMTLVSTGYYRSIYTADVADALEQLVWTFSVVEGGATRVIGRGSLVVDDASAGGGLTADQVIDALKLYEHDTDVTFDGLCKRLEAMLGGAATNLKGTTGDGTVTYYLRDGVTVAFSGILDPVAGNRGASNVSTSETP